VAGLVFLFAPTPFEAWPVRWRDGRAVLAGLLAMQVGTLAVLYQLGGGLLDRFV
jgi:hypothetical protein